MAQDQIKIIEERLGKLAAEMDRLQDEIHDLEIAKRVLNNLTGNVAETATISSAGSPRPTGIPTNFEMVDMVLSSAEKEGQDGLTSKELLDAIRARYWPGMKSGQIMPIIYGFVKKERLRKTAGGKFKRVKNSQQSQ